LVTTKRASSRRAVSSPTGQARSTQPNQDRCLSSTARSTLLSLSAPPIASRAMAWASRARPRCTSSLPRGMGQLSRVCPLLSRWPGLQQRALLDGGKASGLYAPELARDDAPGHGGYGPIITVVD
jgi:hypothetical protein